LHASAVTTAEQITQNAEQEAAEIVTHARQSPTEDEHHPAHADPERRVGPTDPRGGAGSAATRPGHRKPGAGPAQSTVESHQLEKDTVDKKPADRSTVDRTAADNNKGGAEKNRPAAGTTA
jgi:hypothetical protein